MISLSWALICSSILAICALMPPTTESLPTVMPWSSTWMAYSLSRPWAKGRCESSRIILLSCMKRSMTGSGAGAVPAACGVGSAMLFSSVLCGAVGGGFLELLHLVGVAGHGLQHVVELVVAIELGQQIVELLARLKQFAQGFVLHHDVQRRKIVHVPELELDVGFAAIFGQLVVDLGGHARGDGLQDIVEVVAINLNELTVLEFGQRFFRFSREIGQNTHHQRQFFLLDGAANLNVIGDLYPGWPDTIQFMLSAFRHKSPLCLLLSCFFSFLCSWIVLYNCVYLQKSFQIFQRNVAGHQFRQQLFQGHPSPGDGAPDQIRRRAVRLRAYEVISDFSQPAIGFCTAADRGQQGGSKVF